MSPHGCQKMSAKPCKRDAEDFTRASLSNRKPKPPNCLLIQDKTFYSLAQNSADAVARAPTAQRIWARPEGPTVPASTLHRCGHVGIEKPDEAESLVSRGFENWQVRT